MEPPFFSWEQNKKYYLLPQKRLTALHKNLKTHYKKLKTHYKKLKTCNMKLKTLHEKLKAHYVRNKICFHRFTRYLSFFDKLFMFFFVY